jgi:hypothetical protein
VHALAGVQPRQAVQQRRRERGEHGGELSGARGLRERVERARDEGFERAVLGAEDEGVVARVEAVEGHNVPGCVREARQVR